MAATVVDVKFTYENTVDFKMQVRTDAGAWTTIVEMEENGILGSLWPNVQDICETYLKSELTTIGNVMKAA